MYAMPMSRPGLFDPKIRGLSGYYPDIFDPDTVYVDPKDPDIQVFLSTAFLIRI